MVVVEVFKDLKKSFDIIVRSFMLFYSMRCAVFHPTQYKEKDISSVIYNNDDKICTLLNLRLKSYELYFSLVWDFCKLE